jgi:hypothetical protein
LERFSQNVPQRNLRKRDCKLVEAPNPGVLQRIPQIRAQALGESRILVNQHRLESALHYLLQCVLCARLRSKRRAGPSGYTGVRLQAQHQSAVRSAELVDRIVIDLARREAQDVGFQSCNAHLFLNVSSRRKCWRCRKCWRSSGCSSHA